MYYTSASVRRHPVDKAWYGILRYKDAEGKWRQKTRKFAGCPNKSEAKRRLVVWREEMENEKQRALCLDDAIEYANRLVDYKVAMRSIQPATEKDYRASFAAWRPYLQGTALSEVTREQIEHGMQRMLADGLSVNTVIKRQVALSMLFEHAILKGDVRSNVMRGIERPKKERTVPNALVGDDLERVKRRIETLPLEWWTVGIALCLYAGLRAEETCGLQFADIDLADNVGWIRRSIGHGTGGTYVSPPKNRNARDFPICAALHGILSDWIGLQRGRYAALGIEVEPTSWLLGEPDKGWQDSQRMGKKWSMLCDIDGYKGLAGKKPRIHDLRHTFATACVKAGMDVKTLQSILGHASAAITLDIYASCDPQAKKAAASVIDAAL